MAAGVVAASPRNDASFPFFDPVVVDARVPAAHQPVLVELPVLVSVAAPPLPVDVVRLVLEAHRDAVVGEAPELLAGGGTRARAPTCAQKGDDGLAALEELVAVAPLRVLGVGGRDTLGVAGVPAVLRGLHLLACRFGGERWHRRSVWHGLER